MLIDCTESRWSSNRTNATRITSSFHLSWFSPTNALLKEILRGLERKTLANEMYFFLQMLFIQMFISMFASYTPAAFWLIRPRLQMLIERMQSYIQCATHPYSLDFQIIREQWNNKSQHSIVISEVKHCKRAHQLDEHQNKSLLIIILPEWALTGQ